jgi:predicted RNase H-like HicB family nuclease
VFQSAEPSFEISDFFDINKAMKISGLKNIVWKENRYYVAQSLNVDVSSFGKTKREALKNLKEALELFFDETKRPKVAKVERPEVVTL